MMAHADTVSVVSFDSIPDYHSEASRLHSWIAEQCRFTVNELVTCLPPPTNTPTAHSHSHSFSSSEGSAPAIRADSPLLGFGSEEGGRDDPLHYPAPNYARDLPPPTEKPLPSRPKSTSTPPPPPPPHPRHSPSSSFHSHSSSSGSGSALRHARIPSSNSSSSQAHPLPSPRRVQQPPAPLSRRPSQLAREPSLPLLGETSVLRTPDLEGLLRIQTHTQNALLLGFSASSNNSSPTKSTAGPSARLRSHSAASSSVVNGKNALVHAHAHSYSYSGYGQQHQQPYLVPHPPSLHQLPTSPLPPSSPPTRRQSSMGAGTGSNSRLGSRFGSTSDFGSLIAEEDGSRGSLALGFTSGLGGTLRNAVYIDSEEVKERLDELLLMEAEAEHEVEGGGREELVTEKEHETEGGLVPHPHTRSSRSSMSSRLTYHPHPSPSLPYASQHQGLTQQLSTAIAVPPNTPLTAYYQTPFGSSSQVYLGPLQVEGEFGDEREANKDELPIGPAPKRPAPAPLLVFEREVVRDEEERGVVVQEQEVEGVEWEREQGVVEERERERDIQQQQEEAPNMSRWSMTSSIMDHLASYHHPNASTSAPSTATPTAGETTGTGGLSVPFLLGSLRAKARARTGSNAGVANASPTSNATGLAGGLVNVDSSINATPTNANGNIDTHTTTKATTNGKPMKIFVPDLDRFGLGLDGFGGGLGVPMSMPVSVSGSEEFEREQRDREHKEQKEREKERKEKERREKKEKAKNRKSLIRFGSHEDSEVGGAGAGGGGKRSRLVSFISRLGGGGERERGEREKEVEGTWETLPPLPALIQPVHSQSTQVQPLQQQQQPQPQPRTRTRAPPPPPLPLLHHHYSRETLSSSLSPALPSGSSFVSGSVLTSASASGSASVEVENEFGFGFERQRRSSQQALQQQQYQYQQQQALSPTLVHLGGRRAAYSGPVTPVSAGFDHLDASGVSVGKEEVLYEWPVGSGGGGGPSSHAGIQERRRVSVSMSGGGSVGLAYQQQYYYPQQQPQSQVQYHQQQHQQQGALSTSPSSSSISSQTQMQTPFTSASTSALGLAFTQTQTQHEFVQQKQNQQRMRLKSSPSLGSLRVQTHFSPASPGGGSVKVNNKNNNGGGGFRSLAVKMGLTSAGSSGSVVSYFQQQSPQPQLQQSPVAAASSPSLGGAWFEDGDASEMGLVGMGVSPSSGSNSSIANSNSNSFTLTLPPSRKSFSASSVSIHSTKPSKRKLVVSGVGEEDVKGYEAVKAWCEAFGEVKKIERREGGVMVVDFKKGSVAERVCRLQAQVNIKGAGSVTLSWVAKKGALG